MRAFAKKPLHRVRRRLGITLLILAIAGIVWSQIPPLGLDTWLPQHPRFITWLAASRVPAKETILSRSYPLLSEKAAETAALTQPGGIGGHALAAHLGWSPLVNDYIWGVSVIPKGGRITTLCNSPIGGPYSCPQPAHNYNIVLVDAYTGDVTAAPVYGEDPGIPPWSSWNAPLERLFLIWPGLWV